MNEPRITIVGGGLAGTEAALQLADRGFDVDLYEMRPVRRTEAHRSERLAELEIGLLAPVATVASVRLRGRRTLRASVWLRLVDAAERDDARQMRLLATLGKQWAIRLSLGIEGSAPTSRGFRC